MLLSFCKYFCLITSTCLIRVHLNSIIYLKFNRVQYLRIDSLNMLILIRFESGLVGLPTGNRVWGNTHRGFESHSLRHNLYEKPDLSGFSAFYKEKSYGIPLYIAAINSLTPTIFIALLMLQARKLSPSSLIYSKN